MVNVENVSVKPMKKRKAPVLHLKPSPLATKLARKILSMRCEPDQHDWDQPFVESISKLGRAKMVSYCKKCKRKGEMRVNQKQDS